MCQSTCQTHHSFITHAWQHLEPSLRSSCLLRATLHRCSHEEIGHRLFLLENMKHSVCFLLITQVLYRSVACTKPLHSPALRVTSVLDVLALDRHHRHRKETICEKTDWRKHVMKLIKEVPFAGIFRDLKGETKFEASGLVHVNNTYYAVFDRCKHSQSCRMTPHGPRGPLHATQEQAMLQSSKSRCCG